MAAKRKQHQNQNSENSNSRSNQRNGNTKLKNGRHSEHGDKSKDNSSKYNWIYGLCVICIAITVGVCHRNHVSFMFESDKHYSHLSALERELSFRTEMGLYYSYYKTMIESPTFYDGLNEIMYDNVTEYPLTINTLKRFNLYPEVILAIGYRSYEAVNAFFKRETKLCWTVNRGQGLPPISSCEGLGEPSYFYVESVFALHGVMMAIFFLFGTYLSESLCGGILTVAAFFFNHGECTRVQWTPPLRETFAYPFFVIEMFLITHILRIKTPNYKHSLLLALSVSCFMLPWQFAQFALLTQILSLFGTYILQFIGPEKMKIILLGHMAGFGISYIFLFGNEMLLASFYFSGLVTALCIVFMQPLLEALRYRLLIWFTQGICLIGGTVGVKILISKVLHVADDAHIGDILKSKFTDFQSFHTMLYTCAVEFDFMEKETPVKISKTLLAPSLIIVVAVTLFKLMKQEFSKKDNKQAAGDSMEIPENNGNSLETTKPHAEVVYHLFQMLLFTIMAVIIMRLKLFWTPHLCLIISLLASRQLFGWIRRRETHYALIVVLLAGMSYQGAKNLQHQWSIMGEFSNAPMEELVEWIKASTPENGVFAGPMPIMATIKLCTKRPIVNHPHYEDVGLRERTKRIYTMYSRKPASEVKKHFVDLKVDYIVLDESWCFRRSRPGCGLAEIWDLEDQANLGKIPLCAKLRRDPAPHFKRLFKNRNYDILQVLDEYPSSHM